MVLHHWNMVQVACSPCSQGRNEGLSHNVRRSELLCFLAGSTDRHQLATEIEYELDVDSHGDRKHTRPRCLDDMTSIISSRTELRSLGCLHTSFAASVYHHLSSIQVRDRSFLTSQLLPKL